MKSVFGSHVASTLHLVSRDVGYFISWATVHTPYSRHLCQLWISTLLLLHTIPGGASAPVSLVMSVEKALRLENKTFPLVMYKWPERPGCHALGLQLTLLSGVLSLFRDSLAVVTERHLPKAAVAIGLLHCTKARTLCESSKSNPAQREGRASFPRASAPHPVQGAPSLAW